MKCYHVLDCSILDEIQSQAINYLKNNTNLLVVKPDEPWNTANTKEVLKSCPSLIAWLKSQKLYPNEISFIVYHDIGIGLDIHTDDPRLISKINIPIQHTHGNVTRWHDEQDAVIAEYDMIAPVVFNSSIPHSVEIYNENLPRVIMAVMCQNEKRLLDLLTA
jgi:hypothetical protein